MRNKSVSLIASLLAIALVLVLPLAALVLNPPITKTAFESYNCGVDFSKRVGTDTISIVSVTATNANTGSDATGSVIAASPTPFISAKSIVFRVQGGTAGQTYLISVRVLDSTTGETFDGQIYLTVTR